MKIKDRNEILTDIIKDGKKHPKGWNAVFGKDIRRMSNDYYLFNPNTGIYLLKEYQKNPFQIRGIGGKIARHIDEDIEENIIKKSGDFGIIQGDLRKIMANLEKGVHPKKILDAAVNGKKNLGLSMPIRGNASKSEDAFNNIQNNYSSKQKKLDSKFEEIASEDGLYKSYD